MRPFFPRAVTGLLLCLFLAPGTVAAGGALQGKTVYLSAGHGWSWNGTAWATQRSQVNQVLEDLLTAEFVDQLLVDELRRMGARVVTLREVDMNPSRVVVDDIAAVAEGTVVEEPSGDVGFGGALPVASGVNPFEAGAARLIRASAIETGRMVYAIEVPVSGSYAVYVSHVAGADRAPDAHVRVRHAAGESTFRIDQRRHGGTWILLGTFWFDAGAPSSRSSVAIANDSATPGSLVSLDAVRVGGGLGAVSAGGTTGGRPQWEYGAATHAQLMGAPSSVYATNDVMARPRFAAWDHLPDEDAVYLGIHLVNGSAVARGTASYAYGASATPTDLSGFAGTAGSLELLAAVHSEVVSDLRAAWDPTWSDLGQFTQDLGELRPSANDEMPSGIVALANEVNATDASALLSPAFLRISARAVAQGIARYFATKDGAGLVLPPEPPTALRLQADGSGGGLLASWRIPASNAAGGDAPTGYRVYVSRDGGSYDDGTVVAGTSLALAVPAGEARYVRVTATNAGGESAPTEVVGARCPAVGSASILIVGGFDRLDRPLAPVEALPGGNVARILLDRMNSRSYATRHGAALAAAGFSFDGAADEAVELGDVDLLPYRAVDWFVGRESTADEPFSAAARAAITAYLGAGGRLFTSGSEIGWALDQGGAETRAFLGGTLHALLTADDAASDTVVGAGGAFAALPPLAFAGEEPGAYDVPYPDAWTAAAGAIPVLSYQGGLGGTAALAWADGAARGLLFGFPFEAIRGESVRAEVMRLAMAQLGVSEPAPPSPPVAVDDSATTDEDSPVVVDVLANDTDVNGDTLAITGCTDGAEGTATVSGGLVTYSPAANFHGTDTFSCTISDGTATAIGAVQITVNPVNDPPTANDQSVTVAVNGSASITLIGADVDQDPLSFAVETPPAHGSLTGSGPTLTYVPEPDYQGPDSFTFSVSDGSVGSAAATVTLTVSPAIEPPKGGCSCGLAGELPPLGFLFLALLPLRRRREGRDRLPE